VNTILNKDGVLTGYNTDAIGFLQSLRKHGELEPAGKSVLILGAGGSARAVSVALAKEGASSIFVANRDLQRAQRLVDTLRPLGNFSGAVALDSQSMKSIASNSDIIVNCTPLGMHGSTGATLSPIDTDLISQKALVVDLVYNPSETPLLHRARRIGAKTLGGLYMLVYQGSASFKIWTDLDPPLEIMFEIANKALAEKYTN
jgi:shikimate dehydrogenase